MNKEDIIFEDKQNKKAILISDKLLNKIFKENSKKILSSGLVITNLFVGSGMITREASAKEIGNVEQNSIVTPYDGVPVNAQGKLPKDKPMAEWSNDELLVLVQGGDWYQRGYEYYKTGELEYDIGSPVDDILKNRGLDACTANSYFQKGYDRARVNGELYHAPVNNAVPYDGVPVNAQGKLPKDKPMAEWSNDELLILVQGGDWYQRGYEYYKTGELEYDIGSPVDDILKNRGLDACTAASYFQKGYEASMKDRNISYLSKEAQNENNIENVTIEDIENITQDKKFSDIMEVLECSEKLIKDNSKEEIENEQR